MVATASAVRPAGRRTGPSGAARIATASRRETGLPSSWSPAGREPRLEGALRVALGAGRVRQSGLPLERERRHRQGAREDAGAPGLPRRRHRASWSGRSASTSSTRDVPAHRVGWASPPSIPATGNVYAFGVDGHLHALDQTGKLLWQRQLTEEFGAITTHGGRTVSPVIEGDLVIVSTLNVRLGRPGARPQPLLRLRQDAPGHGLGQLAADQALRHQLLDADRAHRRRPPAAVVGRQRRYLPRARGHHRRAGVAARAQQARDPDERRAYRGTTRVPDPQRGEPRHERDGDGRRARRRGRTASSRPTSSPGARYGFQGGFASPVLDAERLYKMDNGAVLCAFELASGKRALGARRSARSRRPRRCSPTASSTSGTENGKFYILKPTPSGVRRCSTRTSSAPRRPRRR